MDRTRGLCRGDKELLKFLEFHGVTWHLVLTKADLLDASELAQSMLAVQTDADRIVAASAVAQRKRAEKAAAKALARGEDPEVKAEKALSTKLKAVDARTTYPNSNRIVLYVNKMNGAILHVYVTCGNICIYNIWLPFFFSLSLLTLILLAVVSRL